MGDLDWSVRLVAHLALAAAIAWLDPVASRALGPRPSEGAAPP